MWETIKPEQVKDHFGEAIISIDETSSRINEKIDRIVSKCWNGKDWNAQYFKKLEPKYNKLITMK